MAKFGSVAWQEEQTKKIMNKLLKGEPLEDYERTFIQIQTEHNRRLINLKKKKKKLKRVT